MIRTAHFWKIFFHGHQSCKNISGNKKTAKLRYFKSQGASDGAFTCVPRKLWLQEKPPCYNEFKVRQPNSIQQGGIRMDNNSSYSNSLFLFCGKCCGRLQILYFDKAGFVIYSKWIDSGRFQ